MGITTAKLFSQKLLIKKLVSTGLNQFMLSCQILLIHKKDVVTKNYNFLSFVAKMTLKTIWINIPINNLQTIYNDFLSGFWDGCDICGYINGKTS